MSKLATKALFVPEHSGLERAAEDLFLRRRQGHLDSFLYSTPLFAGDKVRGSQYWAQFIQTTTSYKIPVQEAALINNAAPFLKKFTGSFDQFIDFGPGSVEAFNAKTRPLLNQLNIDTYRPIDLCADFLDEIDIIMQHTNPEIKIQAENRDFLLDQIAPATKPSWLYWVGLGFANIPTENNHGLPIKDIIGRLTRMRTLLQGGGHCMLTLDSTNDQAALMRAYHHPIVINFITNLMYQIQRDCPNINLDPAGWTYRPIWHPERYVLEHHIVALRPQRIDLSNETVYVKTGESFVTDHSFKIPATLVAEVAESVGWSHKMTLGDDGQVQLLILSC